MTLYIDLDEDEIINTVKINDRDYKIWDIPDDLIMKILNIKTWFLVTNKSLLKQWKPILKEILEIKNDDVRIELLSDKKIAWLIQIITEKIKNNGI